jgi:hypothetical protein
MDSHAPAAAAARRAPSGNTARRSSCGHGCGAWRSAGVRGASNTHRGRSESARARSVPALVGAAQVLLWVSWAVGLSSVPVAHRCQDSTTAGPRGCHRRGTCGRGRVRRRRQAKRREVQFVPIAIAIATRLRCATAPGDRRPQAVAPRAPTRAPRHATDARATPPRPTQIVYRQSALQLRLAQQLTISSAALAAPLQAHRSGLAGSSLQQGPALRSARVAALQFGRAAAPCRARQRRHRCR